MSKMTRWAGRRRSSGSLPGLSLGQTRDLLRGLGRFLRGSSTLRRLPDLVVSDNLPVPPELQEAWEAGE